MQYWFGNLLQYCESKLGYVWKDNRNIESFLVIFSVMSKTSSSAFAYKPEFDKKKNLKDYMYKT